MAAINKQKPGISCGGICKNAYHVSCAKVPSDILKITHVAGFSWKCPECQNSLDADASLPRGADSHSTVDSNGTALVNVLLTKVDAIFNEVRDIKNHQADLTKSVQFCCEKIDDFQKELLDTNKILINMDEKVSAMDKLTTENASAINALSNRVEQLEQYTRSNNLEIQGVDERAGENVYIILETIGNAIGCPIARRDIDIAHRVSHLSANNKMPKSIIARFISRLTRDAFLAAAKNFKKKSNRQEPGISINDISNKLFINEHLTGRNKILLSKAKAAARDKQFKYVWTRYGQVFMRRNDTSAIFRVNCEADLLKLK